MPPNWLEAEKRRIDLEQEYITYAKTKEIEFIELPPEELNRLHSILEEIYLKKVTIQ